jgi:PQQ-like domain
VLAVNPITGSPLPGFNSNIVGDIEALAVDAHHLYVGGEGLVALDPMTGVQDTRFDPIPINLSGQPQFTGDVFSVVPQPGRLLVGGSFNALGGAAGPLVALDLNTGIADRSFRPQVDGPIYDMSQSGSTLWVAGSFDRVGGVPAGNLVALNAVTGIRNTGIAPRFNGQVNGVRAGSGSIYAGGQFYLVNASHNNGFAQVQGSTGALNPNFHPRSPSSPTITAGGDRLVAATDQFQGYDPHDRRHPYEPTRSSIEMLDPATGLPTHALRLRSVSNVSGIALSRSSLFVAQRIESNIRFPHNVVTVYDLHSGRTEHRWRLPLAGYITQLAVADGRLYAAGSFKRTRSNGQQANLAIAALDPATGRLLTIFDPHANGPVYALASKGRELYFAGLFGQVGGYRRGGLAAVDLVGGSLDRGFTPTIRGDNSTTLTSLPLDLFLQNPFGAFFVRYGTGSLNADAAGGLHRFITATAPTPHGLLIGATILTPLQGQSATDLNFVRTVPAGGS